MSKSKGHVSFLETKESELNAMFNSNWRLCAQSPEATNKSPFGAWIEVEIEPLRLRLVHDRGLDHVDVRCQSTHETDSWVSLEILSVAALPETFDRYLEKFEATLLLENQEELKTCAQMYDKPLAFIFENKPLLVETARNAQAIQEAETKIANKTRAILAEVVKRN